MNTQNTPTTPNSCRPAFRYVIEYANGASNEKKATFSGIARVIEYGRILLDRPTAEAVQIHTPNGQVIEIEKRRTGCPTIRRSSQEDINFTEVNCDFRRLLREHDGDEVINNPEHQEDAAKAFDLADEYCAQLAATIYNAWDDLCKLYNNIKTSCNWFFGASMEEAASDPETNPWDVYVAPNDVF